MDIGAFLGNLIPTLILAAWALLAHLGYQHRWAWWATKISLWLYGAGLALFTLLMGSVLYMMTAHPERLSSADLKTLTPEILQGLVLGSTAITVVTLLVLLPWTRRLLFRLFPGSANSLPQEVGAIFFLSAITAFLVYLGFYFDLGAMVDMLSKMNLLEGVITFLILQIILVVAGVGTFVTRSVPQALARLGLTPVSGEVGLKMVGVGFIAFIAVFFGGEYLLKPFVSPELRALEHALKPPGDFPWSLLTGFLIALGAGFGEELFFRGLLQPAFGLVPTAILFALIHFHYGLTPFMLMVLVLGLMFGWLRKRYNTTASFIAHASYDLFALITTTVLTFMAQQG